MKSLKTFASGKIINVVVETPKGSRNKYCYQPDTGFYMLSKVVPAGTSFPFDFGFVPGTRAADGDPVDALVIVETECFPGCCMECHVIGVIEVMQKEKGEKPERNDRLVVVPVESIDHSELRHIKDMNKNLMNELIHFFEYYNKMRNKEFTFLGVKGPKEALRLIKKQVVKTK